MSDTKPTEPPESVKFELWDSDERFKFFGLMASLGVHHVIIEFNGSGDSGQVDSVSAYAADGNTIDLDADIAEKMDKFCCDYLDHLGIEWYSNSGGYGSLTLHIGADAEMAKAELDYYERIESTQQHTHEFEL